MNTRHFAFLIASAGLAVAAATTGEFNPERGRLAVNPPRPFPTNQYSLTNRFGTNDPAFTNRFRTNAPGPIAPRDRKFPPDTFPPDRFPPDDFPPDRFAPDRFPPIERRPRPDTPPVVPPELEPPVRPSVPPPPAGRPKPPKSLTIVPGTPGASPVTISVRARPVDRLPSPR